MVRYDRRSQRESRTGRGEVSLASRVSVVVLAALMVGAAQSSDRRIVVERGASRQAIARLDAAGRWVEVAEGGCLGEGAVGRVVATGGPQEEVPRRVTPGEESWSAVQPVIARVFAQRQGEHRLSASNVTSVPITFDWLYAAPGQDGFDPVFYFEASRRIPDPGTAPDDDPRGTLRVAVSGWLAVEADGAIVPLGSKSELRWEQETDAGAAAQNFPDSMPLGIVRHGAQTVWVMEMRIGTILRFTLYEPGSTGVRKLFEAAAVRC